MANHVLALKTRATRRASDLSDPLQVSSPLFSARTYSVPTDIFDLLDLWV
ncbi:hypothetical protein PDIG_28840 [Penicillium digitatum PHI26]|uniref:Uncharacterized protein n=2 Tax=Penicillium digitatum TaxID=36651 RepID=K9GKF0_PEND2|nr:hypothetical protein PDIP_63280 [Penicillium digitatum Pd1]EKV09834.1 hypothetical protein PDIP_63280 [Penicillium digitatum Pd1]EKV15203.1 hypothetical protein PDIG_28840 [Penicillium digitatum PHI26]